ncbi:hypothetical protein [Pseudomonas fluorescens]|uniref:Uncharacterized protein n=1 Tax=Pseudomonas fluorescens TaxID=294 RepID=A0A0F4V6Q4_PSEFL|nr:hypothetical protein [Pseudomonas fluorescens]KJZ64523.1 hypothetical protein VD17_17365 [Pseudomonas fluorescens]
MHPSFLQRIDELGDLLVHSNATRIELVRRTNRQKSRRGVRYQVVTLQLGIFQVIERYTGTTWAYRFNYREAMDFAIQLEEKSNRRKGVARCSAG